MPKKRFLQGFYKDRREDADSNFKIESKFAFFRTSFYITIAEYAKDILSST